ncbi:hypothetical protein V6N12_050819 [Hibiscus sabdariffa]|uniref:Plastid lipid-associated protein/fibrillin conserved domain-containing protein n=1 Tax=Hibiscus sabdariffa TaxID=183260 RepID=A0ABR2GDH8_9ROSI
MSLPLHQEPIYTLICTKCNIGLQGEDCPSVAVAEPQPNQTVEIQRLKKALVDSFVGTDRGLKANSETRAEIVELITQLEAKNPTPAPTHALPLLNGKWILAYVLPLAANKTRQSLCTSEMSRLKGLNLHWEPIVNG